MTDPQVAADAKRYGIKSLPAVVINWQLASCCQGGGVDLADLWDLGLGQS
jgi:glutaredoxin 3